MQPFLFCHVLLDMWEQMLQLLHYQKTPNESKETVLIIDVGTNAELILGNKYELYACSSPTGPAFEGAQISSGQRAAPGAIEKVKLIQLQKIQFLRL